MKKLFFGKIASDSPAVAVVMAGGQGARFWPASRLSCPKQFLRMPGSERSLIQGTVDRLQPDFAPSQVMVVTNVSQAALVQEHLPEVAVLAEPVARNTAACIAYAAKVVLASAGDVPMVCLPADHIISPASGLREVIGKAVQVAEKSDVLVTIGIKPDSPETGYGYIHRGNNCGLANGTAVYKVRSFVEKPSLETAEEYLKSGDYYWNSGMFVWRPSVILEAIGNYLPDMAEKIDKVAGLLTNDVEEESRFEQAREIFSSIKPVSIDVGVLEKSSNTVIIPADSFAWNDVGSWDSWALAANRDSYDGSDNLIMGDALTVNCRDSVLVSSSGRTIAAVGLEGIVVIETADAVLVCDRRDAQSVKTVVELLKQQGRELLL
ncbi:MAG: sugar phosphate nucleotidyltransferase [bacterium]|nr:sugar phosphate nucleotidyltransferase [bacterium]